MNNKVWILLIIIFGIIIFDYIYLMFLKEKLERRKIIHNGFPKVPGPTPWYYEDGMKILINKSIYYIHNKRNIDSIICLQNKKKKNILIVGMYVYIQQISEEKLLIWKEINDKVRILLIDISKLDEIKNREFDEKDSTFYKLNESAIIYKYDLAKLKSGNHVLQELNKFNLENNILILFNYISDEKNKNEIYRAIYDINFKNNEINVYPQKWFNESDKIDFGYQWITRVSKNENGRIVGSGIRIDDFELDSSNMYLQE